MNLSNSILFGKLIKTKGVKGHLIVQILSPESICDFEKTEVVFLKINGKPVPFFISECDVMNDKTAVVKFDYINEDVKAKELTSTEIFIDVSEKINNSSQNIEDIIGFTAIDQNDNAIGELIDVVDIDKSPLFVIKALDKEHLIPINNTIEKIDYNNRKIYLAIIDGLLSL